MEQLNKEELDVQFYYGPVDATAIEATRQLASRHQEHLDARAYNVVVDDLKSDIARIGKKLPKFDLLRGGYGIRQLYFGGLAYLDIGLACFKLLYSLEDYSQRFAKPFDEMVVQAADQYRSFAQEHGVEYLNKLDVKEQFSKLKTGGCFIASAAYRTEFAPDVIILKRYRDGILLKSRFGKAIIQVYYFISPPVARAIQKSEVLGKLTRNILVSPLVKVFRCRRSYTDGNS